MPDLHIHRVHSLGLERAREVAWQWAEEVESKFDMACTVIEGDDTDTVEFSRTGVKGTLVVAGDHFELDAKLGFLLGAFSKTIEAQIQDNLDQLLGSAEKAKKAAGKVVAKAAAKAPVKPAAKAAKKKT
jgi:putative polyhydroxyalkanoate system protein